MTSRKRAAPDGPASSDELSTRTMLWVGAALVVVAVALRVYRLASKELWLDEANAVLIAQRPIPDLVAALRLDSSPPLYYVLLHYWMAIWGTSEAAVRSLSVVGGVLLVVTVLRVAWTLLGTRVAVLAGAFMALAPVQIEYSQQARQYTFLPIASLASVYFLCLALRDPRWRYACGYVVATLASLYLHNFSLFLLPAHATIWLVAKGWRLPWKLTAVPVVLVVVGYLPWVPSLLVQVERMGFLSWVSWMWGQIGITGVIATTLLSFTAGTPWSATPVQAMLGMSRWWYLLIPVVAATIAASVRRRDWTSPRFPHGPGPLLVAFAVPLAIGLFATVCLRHPSYVPGRVDQLVFSTFCIVLAAGVLALPRLAGIAVVLVLIASDLAGVVRYHGDAREQGARQASLAIARSVRAGDAVVFTGLTRASVEYYLRRQPVDSTLVSFPRHVALHLGNEDPEALLANPDDLAREAREVVIQLGERTPVGASVYVVIEEISPVGDFLVAELARSRLFAAGDRFGPFVPQRLIPYRLQQYRRADAAP